MKLLCGTIRPGKVLKVEENGLIKATAPGLFSDQDAVEDLPPIYPWPFHTHSNSYSSIKTNDEIWLMNFSDNLQQLYWIRKDYAETNSNFPISDEGENVEIVVNREFEDSEWATIYFSNGDGWVIREGDKGVIQIRKDGSILLESNYDKGVIDVNDKGISLGSRDTANNHAMLYEEWDKWLKNDLCGTFLTNLQSVLAANPYTSPAAAAMPALINALKTTGMNIKSNYITITGN